MPNPDPIHKGSRASSKARWAAAPYCAFQDDKARLRALVSRDIRLAVVTITGMFLAEGANTPWRSLMSWLHG